MGQVYLGKKFEGQDREAEEENDSEDDEDEKDRTRQQVVFIIKHIKSHLPFIYVKMDYATRLETRQFEPTRLTTPKRQFLSFTEKSVCSCCV